MLKELFSSNPLLIDFRRSVRKFFGIGRQGRLNFAVATVAALIYGLVLLIAVTSREYLSPISFIILLNVLFCLIVPATMHGAIAGERERRSWDFLLVAPISNAQIIAGKFLSGLGLIALMTVLLLPMMAITYKYDSNATLGRLVGTMGITIGYAIFLNAFSLYVSSRSRRAFAANLSIYGLQFLALVAYPILVLVLSGGRSETWAFFLHPFVVNVAVWTGSTTDSHDVLLTGGGLFQAATFVIMALALLGWTEATLRDMDRKDGGG
jgi:ABC-type transport system involved in multi-copper enzyme maturation permease subunit